MAVAEGVGEVRAAEGAHEGKVHACGEGFVLGLRCDEREGCCGEGGVEGGGRGLDWRHCWVGLGCECGWLIGSDNIGGACLLAWYGWTP